MRVEHGTNEHRGLPSLILQHIYISGSHPVSFRDPLFQSLLMPAEFKSIGRVLEPPFQGSERIFLSVKCGGTTRRPTVSDLLVRMDRVRDEYSAARILNRILNLMGRK